MEQAAKRVRCEVSIENSICPAFNSKHRSLVVYFFIALKCSTPIVEALLFTTFAKTAVKDELGWNWLVNELYRLFVAQARIYHPFSVVCDDTHEVGNLSTGDWFRITLTKGRPEHWMQRDLRVVKFFKGHQKREECFLLSVSKHDKIIYMLSQQTGRYNRPVKWNCLQSIIDEQIEYLILPPKGTT